MARQKPRRAAVSRKQEDTGCVPVNPMDGPDGGRRPLIPAVSRCHGICNRACLFTAGRMGELARGLSNREKICILINDFDAQSRLRNDG